MSRGHGAVQRFVLDALREHGTLTLYDLALLRWPQDRAQDGLRSPYQDHVESMRRAAEKLADEGLVTWAGWTEDRDLDYSSPVGHRTTNPAAVYALAH